MRTTKVFSVENGTLNISANDIYLFNDSQVLATTNKLIGEYNRHILPSTLIRTPKSDEELAKEYAQKMYNENSSKFISYNSFLAGRKSFEDKKFHLSEGELIKFYEMANEAYLLDDIIESLTPPIYPHTITVEHDGDNYLWETLKAEYYL